MLDRVEKEDSPEMLPQNFNALMELDQTLNKYLHNSQSSLSDDMKELDNISGYIPEYLEIWDVRKPAHLYVDDMLNSILKDVFRHRARVE